MVNFIWKKMVTLALVNFISIFCFYQVNGEDLTSKRQSRQCATCSIDLAELLTSPWYGVPQSMSARKSKSSRHYRDTRDQESIKLSPRLEGQGEAVIARFGLPNLTFGGKNLAQEKEHERRERSNLQEFEFEGKKYALRQRVEPRPVAIKAEEPAPVESSSNRNHEYLLMLYNGIQKVMQSVDPKKSMYENFEDALFNVVRKIIYDRMASLFENSASEQRTENRRWRNSGGKNEPRGSEPEENDVSLPLVAKQILKQLRSRNEIGDGPSSRNPSGSSRLIATESVAGPRYENPPFVTYQENPGARSPGFFQSPVEQSSKSMIRSTEQAAPRIGDGSASIFLQGRSTGIKKSNRNVNGNFGKASTTLEYESELAGRVYDEGESARFARSEIPTEKTEVLEAGVIGNSPDLARSENLEKFKFLKNLVNSSIDYESQELRESANSTSMSDKLGKALGEYLKPDKSEGLSTETIEIITTFLDELIKFDQAPSTTTQSPDLLSHTENTPTIPEDHPE